MEGVKGLDRGRAGAPGGGIDGENHGGLEGEFDVGLDGLGDRALERSLAVLSALAEGIDPVTGESLPDSCREALVADSLHLAVAALRARAKQRARRARLPANVGKPWRPEEDAALLAAWDAGETLEALAARFGRTRIGIRSRLQRHGRVVPAAQGSAERAAPRSDAAA